MKNEEQEEVKVLLQYMYIPPGPVRSTVCRQAVSIPQHEHRIKKWEGEEVREIGEKEKERGKEGVPPAVCVCVCPLMSLRCPDICSKSACVDTQIVHLQRPCRGPSGHHTHPHYACVQKHMHSSDVTAYTHPNQPPHFSGHTLEASVNLTDNHSFVTYEIKLFSTDTTPKETQNCSFSKSSSSRNSTLL